MPSGNLYLGIACLITFKFANQQFYLEIYSTMKSEINSLKNDWVAQTDNLNDTDAAQINGGGLFSGKIALSSASKLAKYIESSPSYQENRALNAIESLASALF